MLQLFFTCCFSLALAFALALLRSAILGRLEASRGRLGGVLERLMGVLWASWSHLKGALERLGGDLGASWTSWRRLGSVLEASWRRDGPEANLNSKN